MTVSQTPSRGTVQAGWAVQSRFLALGVIVMGALIGPLAILAPLSVAAAIVAVSIFCTVLAKPQYAGYIVLAVAPLIIGIERGSTLPALRPHEALFVLVGLALATRGLVNIYKGHSLTIRLSRVDIALLTLTLLSSVLPLWWEIARAIRPSRDDLLHSLVLWKYLALYAVIKASIKTKDQVRTCLWIVLGVNGVVAVIAILQALRLFGVDRLVATFYPPLGSARLALNGRGTSTLGHSIAVGDVMAMSLAIVVAMYILHSRPSNPLRALIALFALGGVASGQMSGVIALAVAVLVVGYVTKRLARVYLVGVPMLAGAVVLLLPVLNSRLVVVSAESGLPPSWSGRLVNLQTHVWPRVFSDFNYLMGVRPSPRIPAWETWRDWIFIESGYTWFLWVGGVPLLLAFLYFVWTVVRTTARLAHERDDVFAVAAVSACAAMCMFAVLSLLDAHLTLRGAADLLFPLIALALVALPARFVVAATDFRIDQRSGGATRAIKSSRATP